MKKSGIRNVLETQNRTRNRKLNISKVIFKNKITFYLNPNPSPIFAQSPFNRDINSPVVVESKNEMSNRMTFSKSSFCSLSLYRPNMNLKSPDRMPAERADRSDIMVMHMIELLKSTRDFSAMIEFTTTPV